MPSIAYIHVIFIARFFSELDNRKIRVTQAQVFPHLPRLRFTFSQSRSRNVMREQPVPTPKLTPLDLFSLQ